MEELRWLVCIEKIKQLKHQYCSYCDDNYNPEGIASLFTLDGIWDGGDFGRHEGQNAIREFFDGVRDTVTMAIHHVTNPIIKVDGDTAHGQWKLWQPMVYTKNNAAFWYAAEYNDEFKNTDDGWKFTHLRLEAKMHSPYEDGFGKSPFSTS